MGQRIAELLINVHGEAGAVEAAGGGAAVHIAGAQMAQSRFHDGGALAAGGIAGQYQQIAADIALRAVLAGNVIPAVYQTVDGDYGAGVDGGQALAFGGGVGPDVHSALGHAAVGGEDVVLIEDKVIGGHIAGAAVIIDLVPAGDAVIQQGHGHRLVQRGDDGGGGVGLGPHTQGSTGGAAGANGHLFLGRGEGGERQSGEGSKNSGLHGLFHQMLH